MELHAYCGQAGMHLLQHQVLHVQGRARSEITWTHVRAGSVRPKQLQPHNHTPPRSSPTLAFFIDYPSCQAARQRIIQVSRGTGAWYPGDQVPTPDEGIEIAQVICSRGSLPPQPRCPHHHKLPGSTGRHQESQEYLVTPNSECSKWPPRVASGLGLLVPAPPSLRCRSTRSTKSEHS